MKSVILLLFLLFFGYSITVIAKDQAESSLSLYWFDLNPFLEKLGNDNEYVIAYRFINSSQQDAGVKYIVLVKKANVIRAFKVENNLNELNLSKDALSFIWKNFMQNGLLDMRDESELVNVCPRKYHIYNAHTYEFTIIKNSKTKILNYYYPEYFDEVCPGMDERKKIINSVAVLELVLRQNN